MKKIHLLFVMLLSAAGFAQSEKDSLVITHSESLKEELTLMYYLDAKAVHLLTMGADEKALIDEDFKTFFTDSIVAGNPTKLDVSDYLGYKKGKGPKTTDKFFQEVFDTNALNVLKLTRTYGYLSSGRIKIPVAPNRVFFPVQFTVHSSKFDYKLNKLFDQEYKLGNMPESDYALFLIVKKGTVSESEIRMLDEMGVKLNNTN